MEFKDLKEENLVNISFSDVVNVISSDDTKVGEKMVYIYLLNLIMDMEDKIQNIKNKIKEYEDKDVN